MNKPRFIVGIVLAVAAILMFLFGDFPTAGVIAIGLLGLISITTSWRTDSNHRGGIFL